jgi:outer membrane protein assembly factor BamB
MKLLWQVKVGDRVGAPISVGDRVFVPLVDEHQVVAIDATRGNELWRFTTGARIDSPPTYDRGAVVFGSADGCVYRVNAEDGQLAWQLRVVPEDRRIAAFGQLESAWPVSGSVLVDSDPTINSGRAVAYFVAGRSSHLDEGLRLCAADAATGQVQKMAIMAGPEYTVDNIEQNYRLPMGLLPDILRTEESRLFMRSVPFDKTLQRQRGVANMKLRGGFLDDAYFKRMPWSMGKSGHARFLVHDNQHAFCLRMFDSMAGLDPKVFFTPGRAGYLLFAHDLKRGKNAWQLRVPIRGRAMAVTKGQLVIGGPPDLVDAADPLAAFEGRKGGVLRVLDKTTGETISEQQISTPPVFNGAAAANGKLFLSLEDGSVACFGG